MTNQLEKEEETVVMLTTIDNPFNPKTNYIKWKQFDEDKGYDTEEFLGRMVNLPPDADTEDEQLVAQATLEAIAEIIEHDVLGIYTTI